MALLAAGCAAEGRDPDVTAERARELLNAPARPAPVAHVPALPPIAAPAAPEAPAAPKAPDDAPAPVAQAPAEPETPAADDDVPGQATDARPTRTELPAGFDDSADRAVFRPEARVPEGGIVRVPEPGPIMAGSRAGGTPLDVSGDADADPRIADLRPLSATQQMVTDFPWNASGGPWNGTGVKDPAPIRGVSDAEMVAAAVDRSPVPEIRNKRLTALVSIGRRKLPAALSVLTSALDDRDTMVRQIALSGLIELGGPGALPSMWRAFRDPHPFVRGASIWAISLYGPDQAEKAIDAGLADPDPGVQGMAILATTALRDVEKMWPILEKAARSNEQRVYQEAAYVLANLESRKAMEMLAATLRTSTDPLKQRTFAQYLKMARRDHPDLLVAPTAQR
jgi:hypothetical protein